MARYFGLTLYTYILGWGAHLRCSLPMRTKSSVYTSTSTVNVDWNGRCPGSNWDKRNARDWCSFEDDPAREVESSTFV